MISYFWNVKCDILMPKITKDNISYTKIHTGIDAFIQRIGTDKINSVVGNILVGNYKLIISTIFTEEYQVEITETRPDAQIYKGKYRVLPPAITYPTHCEYILEKVK